MKIEIRLEYKDIFDDNKEDILKYLSLVSRKTLEKFIGFSAVNNVTAESFFSNIKTANSIQFKLNSFGAEKKFVLMHSECSLHLAEKILENKELLLENNSLKDDIDRDEINLFKSILLVNEKLNKYDEIISNSQKNDIEKIIDMMIAIKFSSYDLGIYDNIEDEIKKLTIVTFYKFNSLIKFFQSNSSSKYNDILKKLYKSFGQNSIQELKNRIHYLCLKITEIVREGNFSQFEIEKNDKETITFFESLSSKQIFEQKDFLALRNNPLYRLNDGTYSIVNPFFVLDKFTNSIRFLVKDDINYSEDFSEKYLMKNLLDDIFGKKYFVKKKELANKDKEPDYYVRYNKDIFLFEYKDTFINADTKVSRDISKIERELKEKFIVNKNGKAKGIGQLINHIKSISDNQFQYDDLKGSYY